MCKKILKIGVILQIVLLINIVLAGMAYASSAEEEKTQQESWVFLLASAEKKECCFFVNPSLAGYSAGQDNLIEMEIHSVDGDKSIILDSSDTKDGWYTSPEYNFAASTFKKDYYFTVKVYDSEGNPVSQEMDGKSSTVYWPNVKDGYLILAKPSSEKTQEYDVSQWVEITDDSLLNYKIENEKRCHVLLDRTNHKIKVLDAKTGASFKINVEDPSGHRRGLKMSIITGSAVNMGIVAIVVAIVIFAGGFLLLKRRNSKAQGMKAQSRDARVKVEYLEETLVSKLKDIEYLEENIRNTRNKARESLKKNGSGGMYTMDDINESEKWILLADYEPYHALVDLKDSLNTMKKTLLAMSSGQKQNISKDAPAYQNPYKYIGNEAWIESGCGFEEEIDSLDKKYQEGKRILEKLNQIVERKETTFTSDIDITVVVNKKDVYKCRRVARDMISDRPLPGMFSFEQLKFQTQDHGWVQLSEILSWKIDVRVFALKGGIVRIMSNQQMILSDRTECQSMDCDVYEGLEKKMTIQNIEITMRFL